VELLLLCGAQATMLAAGAGATLLLFRRREVHPFELGSLSVLFGAGFVSLASFGLGLVFRDFTLRVLVGAACLTLFVAGGRGLAKGSIRVSRPNAIGLWPTLLLILAMATAGFVTWLAARTPLGWDGIFVWEMKARIAWLNGGAMPAGYFSDPTRKWSQQDYPLFLPLTEAWVYGWIGRPHQALIRALPPLFYLAALGLLYRGVQRLGGSLFQAALATLLPFLVPQVIYREGSACSGYTDFPLAVCYLAAVVFLLAHREEGRTEDLRVAGVAAALLLWIKQDGIVLWGCFVLMSGIALWRRSRRHWLLSICLPGAVLFGGWRLFLWSVGAFQGVAFLPLRVQTLWSNASRLVAILPEVAREMLEWPRWGFFWPALGLALLCAAMAPRNQRRRAALVAVLVILPIALYSLVFLFSTWTPFTSHVKASLPRLLLQVVPLGVLLLASAGPPSSPPHGEGLQ
jgi:hypothetical protein